MDTLTLVLVIVAVIAIGAAIWMYMRKRRSDELRENFGSEYNRTVAEEGDRARAEAELEARRKRVANFDIRPLSPSDREGFSESWRAAQAQFVDNPAGAIAEADRLVGKVMQARGYPMGDFDQRVSDVSVEHAGTVDHYRTAHEIALRNERNEASTEDLRQAMVHYRALFDDLLGSEETPRTEHREARR